jgi:hypothetical protein
LSAIAFQASPPASAPARKNVKIVSSNRLEKLWRLRTPTMFILNGSSRNQASIASGFSGGAGAFFPPIFSWTSLRSAWLCCTTTSFSVQTKHAQAAPRTFGLTASFVLGVTATCFFWPSPWAGGPSLQNRSLDQS